MGNEAVQTARKRLQDRKTQLKDSVVFKKCLEFLKPHGFSRIRCLALGSPVNEFQALYQLAFLELLAEEHEIKLVSCYDPVFTEEDVSLLKELKFEVSEQEDASEGTLYFMPHAPRTFMDEFIRDVKPNLILGNDITVTIGTLSSSAYLEQLPTLATLSHLAEKPELANDDGFAPVTSKKKRNKKYVYEPPKLEYPVDLAYFDSIAIHRLPRENDPPYRDSFSDLALSVISSKNELPDIGALSIKE